MPYGVVIVDDDAVMRMGLRMMIDWETEGFCLLGEAENGETALALIRQAKPDIVITDMKMPVLNGVELIRALRGSQHAPQIVALSSYDDYALVRESMQLGATDYLLKMDLTGEKLLQLLHSLVEQPRAVDDMVRVDVLRAQLVKNMISRFFLSDEDMYEQMRRASIRWESGQAWCLVLKTDDLMNRGEEEYRTLSLSVINIAEEIAQDYLDAFCAEGFTGEFYILGEPREADGDSMLRMRRLAERLVSMIEQYLDLAVTVGISAGSVTVQGMFDACRQARLAARKASLEGNAIGVPEERDAELARQGGTVYDYSVLKCMPQLDHAILMGETTLLHTVMQQVKQAICTPRSSVIARRQMATDLLVNLRDSLRRYDLDKQTPAVTEQARFDEVSQMRHTTEFADWLDILEATLCDGLSIRAEKSVSKEVQRAQEYIDAHYPEEISLSGLAERLRITPGYLSTLMKRELGMTFSEYILHVRMEQAKRLLEQSELRVYEIAERVGYGNPYYFNKLFKRDFGVSPGYYRSKLRQGEVSE